MPNTPDEHRAEISCQSCRKRKVKCDRTYPQCQVCDQTMQTCTYPSGPLKPGPKIGSLRRRKRPRHKADEDQYASPGAWRPAGLESVSTVGAPYTTGLSAVHGEEDGQVATVDAGGPTAEAKALDLSFILHPSHEPSPPGALNKHSNSGSMEQAHGALGVGSEEVERLTTAYFDNMVAINLFHEPTFSTKCTNIGCPIQTAALLASMFTFSVRFSANDEEPQADTNRRAGHFLNLALRYIDDALRECGDLTPPLCLLQACILTAHWQLAQGVRGRAWRMLGTCVRLAYEMNLHLIDVQTAKSPTDPRKWSRDEEKRRAWWAIWEMDVFATTIRRTPTAIDWSQMEVLLPVDDETWMKYTPRSSCFFQRDPTRRWKALESSGNQSPKAWFIVINSLMKDAQKISSPRGIPSQGPESDQVDEARQRLEIIGNGVRCFQLALPSTLRYNQQYLGFDARVPGEIVSKRQAHSSLYNIYVMTQLARLMVYRYDVFKGRFRVALPSHDSDDISHGKESEHSTVKEYFNAADDILAIIHRSSDDHIRYINPFLSNTMWLASAVNLMRSQLCRPGTLRSVLRSRYEVLNLTFWRCVRFWEMSTAVQENFGTLEGQLEMCRHSTAQAPRNSGQDEPSSKQAGAESGTEAAPPTPFHTTLSPPTQGNRLGATYWPTQNLEDTLNTSMLHPSHLSPMDVNPIPNQLLPSATMIDPMFLFGTTPPLGQLLDPNLFSFDLDPGLDWAPPLDLQDMA